MATAVASGARTLAFEYRLAPEHLELSVADLVAHRNRLREVAPREIDQGHCRGALVETALAEDRVDDPGERLEDTDEHHLGW